MSAQAHPLPDDRNYIADEKGAEVIDMTCAAQGRVPVSWLRGIPKVD
jgi:hypothetical protein